MSDVRETYKINYQLLTITLTNCCNICLKTYCNLLNINVNENHDIASAMFSSSRADTDSVLAG